MLSKSLKAIRPLLLAASAPAIAQNVSSPAEASGDIAISPRNGQSQQQQWSDRYECHRWAVDQTGFDPTTATGDVDAAKRDDYQRATTACLAARDYTVR